MKTLLPPEKELLKAKFEQDRALFDEFDGNFDVYLAWYENQDNVRMAPKAYDRFEMPRGGRH